MRQIHRDTPVEGSVSRGFAPLHATNMPVEKDVEERTSQVSFVTAIGIATIGIIAILAAQNAAYRHLDLEWSVAWLAAFAAGAVMGWFGRAMRTEQKRADLRTPTLHAPPASVSTGDSLREHDPPVPLLATVPPAPAILAGVDPVPVESTWSAERLRQTLEEALGGHSLLVVANREPYIHVAASNGAIQVQKPASGLVTALEPVLQACSGTWIAHGSGSADRQTVDSSDRVAVPPEAPTYRLRRIWLEQAEEDGYYYGFANQGLWPLCHVAHVRPVFRSDDWQHYQNINQRFAQACAQEVDVEDPVVLVQDYHFALVPSLLRESLPRATVLTFWHIPWPNSERFGICPWHRELLRGLLGSSIIGFHTEQHCNNFLEACDRYLEARIDRDQRAVFLNGRATLVRAYPISIAWPNPNVAELAAQHLVRSEICQELGLQSEGLWLGVGVDRLDYTKGIEERLAAVDETLTRFPHTRGRLVFVQLSAPSREKIGPYAALQQTIDAQVEAINARWSDGDYKPIVLRRAHHSPQAVFRYLRAADFCYVSSLHDGMNLVAKEFIAAREQEDGVLILSRFTGAARELNEALVVNPYDLQEASDAIARSLAMSTEEQNLRMRTMRNHIAIHNVYRWAGQMLLDATQVRLREGLSRQLSVAARSSNGEFEVVSVSEGAQVP